MNNILHHGIKLINHAIIAIAAWCETAFRIMARMNNEQLTKTELEDERRDISHDLVFLLSEWRDYQFL